MSRCMKAFISTDTTRSVEPSLGFVLNRHKAGFVETSPGMIDVMLESSVDPDDLFQARCDELAQDLSYYRFEVLGVRIEKDLDTQFIS